MPRKLSEETKLGLVMSAGIAVAGSVIGGTLLGYYLDAWLGTGPWLLIVGVILGTAGALIWLYRLVARIQQ
ncbi:MAG: AtpZ/AtpI family protein [Acidobacteria bacterium]|nr:AtpZ/AtpI family protein [Acidobacteriota bacterium]MBI3423775.1 AtpZ/AtpI family protein [Acidobacteriota bacterium]